MTSKKPDIESLRVTFQAERLSLTRAKETLATASDAHYRAKLEVERATEKYNAAADKLACAVADSAAKEPEPVELPR